MRPGSGATAWSRPAWLIALGVGAIGAVTIFWLWNPLANTAAPTDPGPIQLFDPESFAERLDQSLTPTVVNVWASWCIPCRTEAPVLAAAADRFGDRISFVGVNVEDSQTAAADFVDRFRLDFEILFDRPASIRSILGGTGLPTTYFVLPGGELQAVHHGVIGERALIEAIEELLESSSP